MMEKIKTFLTHEEIQEIKDLKNQGRINHSEVEQLKKFLEKNGKKLSVKGWENYNNVYDIYFEKYKDTILGSKYYKEYREQNPSISSSKWDVFIFTQYIDKIDPEMYKNLKFAETINFELNREFIERRLKEIGIKNFDIDNFLLNKDFDFTPYSVNSLVKNEVDSLSNMSSNILNLFDSLTKGLDDDTKDLLKNNFVTIIDFVLKNVSKQDIKEKNSNFRDLILYINNKVK